MTQQYTKPEDVDKLTIEQVRELATARLGGMQRAYNKTRGKIAQGKPIISRREMRRIERECEQGGAK